MSQNNKNVSDTKNEKGGTRLGMSLFRDSRLSVIHHDKLKSKNNGNDCNIFLENEQDDDPTQVYIND